MQKRKIRLPTAITVIASFLLIISVFGMTFRLFKLPDSSGGGSSGTSGGGNTVIVPPSDDPTDETPDDSGENDDLISEELGAFGGKIPDNVSVIKGSVNDSWLQYLSMSETEKGYRFTQSYSEHGSVGLAANNNSDYSDMSYLTIDFDINLIQKCNTICIAPAFYTTSSTLETLGSLRVTSADAIYDVYNGNPIGCVKDFKGLNSLHFTFVFKKHSSAYYGGGSSVCRSIYCYVNGEYIGAIAAHQLSRESLEQTPIYFNGINIYTLQKSNVNTGTTEFTIENLEIFSYGEAYEVKNFDSVLGTSGSLYNCLDWCYYKDPEEAS